jgi:alpha-1,2-mannosyltransferase
VKQLPIAWLLIVAASVTLGIAVQQRQRVALKVQDPLGGHVNDFDRWMMLTPGFIAGDADYVDDLLPTPPVSLLILAPFTALSRANAQFVWVCAKLPLALLAFALSSAIVSRCGGRLTKDAVLLVLACWWLPVVIDMQEGQINFIVLLLLLGALYVVQNDTRASSLTAGSLIGLASALKVTPIIFVGYFFWKRRWMVALWAVCGLVASTLVIPALVFGWDVNLRWLRQWGGIMIDPYVTRQVILYPTSQSFGSFALRLLTPIPIFETARNDIPYGHYMNVVNWSEQIVAQIVLAVMFAVAFVGLVWTRRALPTLRCRRYLVEIAAVMSFMLWFSERTWVHHYVSFVIPLCAAGALLSDARLPPNAHRSVRLSLVMFAAITPLASEAGRVLGPNGVDWAKSAGIFLWPSVVVMAALIHFSGRRERARNSTPPMSSPNTTAMSARTPLKPSAPTRTSANPVGSRYGSISLTMIGGDGASCTATGDFRTVSSAASASERPDARDCNNVKLNRPGW